jgi:hypothetical protein
MTEDRKLEYFKSRDKDIESIICTTANSVSYIFIDDKWQKEDIEGALTIVKRKTYPEIRIIIMNKLAANSLTIDISPGKFEFEIKNGYLMIRDNKAVRCIWIPDVDNSSEQKNKVIESLQLYQKKQQQQQQQQPISTTTTTTTTTNENNNNIDINNPNFSLTKDEFQNILIKLINDDRFITLLHTEYVKSRNTNKTNKLGTTITTLSQPPSAQVINNQQPYNNSNIGYNMHMIQQQQQHQLNANISSSLPTTTNTMQIPLQTAPPMYPGMISSPPPPIQQQQQQQPTMHIPQQQQQQQQHLHQSPPPPPQQYMINQPYPQGIPTQTITYSYNIPTQPPPPPPPQQQQQQQQPSQYIPQHIQQQPYITMYPPPPQPPPIHPPQ